MCLKHSFYRCSLQALWKETNQRAWICELSARKLRSRAPLSSCTEKAARVDEIILNAGHTGLVDYINRSHSLEEEKACTGA